MDNFNVVYQVENIIFQNNEGNFCILKAKNVEIDDSYDKDLESYIIKGSMNGINRGDKVKSLCTWVNDKRYGWQLNAAFSMVQPPSSIKGIQRFLRNQIKGVGKKTIDTLISAYGDQTLEKIKESESNLTCLSGIGAKKAKSIREQIEKYAEIEKLAVFLFKRGVTNYADVATIYEALGDNAIVQIESNPYSICDHVSVLKLPLCETLAKSAGIPCNNSERVKKLVEYFLYVRAYETGNMFEKFSFMKDCMPRILRNHGIIMGQVSEQELVDAVSELKEIYHVVCVQNQTDTMVYMSYLYRIENGIADAVNKLNKKIRFCSSGDASEFFKKYEKETGIIPDEKQKKAVLYSYENQMMLLTGNPGTGKTQTVKAIITFIKHMDKTARIALCSPTGRAAKRMEELTGHQASTIHRYLGIVGDKLDLQYEIADDYIIVDESSMIDAPLFYKLIDAVSRSGASLILVGDKDQLAPVGPGLPFKELIDSKEIPTVVLDQLHRQASKSQINLNAKKILAGADSKSNPLLCDKTRQDFFLYPLRTPEEIKHVVLRIIDQLMSLGTDLSDIIVLSPMRKSSLGVLELNHLIQDHVNPDNGCKDIVKIDSITFRTGDKIMQTKNNYNMPWKSGKDAGLGVYNGDLGIILEIDTGEELSRIQFDDGRIAEFTFDDMKELDLAYAMTVHKAQGCEFPCVIMPCHKELINLSRNIIYTAVTRAKKRFLIPGDPVALYSGIAKTDSIKRNTNLAELLNDTVDTDEKVSA